MNADLPIEATEKALAGRMGMPVDFRTADIGPHRIRYVVAGSGSPLILIHGGTIGWGMWYRNIPELAKRFTVYAVDLPGAGRSSPLDYAHLNPERDFADTMVLWLASLGLSHAAAIGHSTGGWVAARLARRAPERIRKLVLVDAVGFSPDASFAEKIISFYPLARLLARTALAARPGNAAVDTIMMDGFFDKTRVPEREFADYFRESMRRSHMILLVSRIVRLRKSLLFPNPGIDAATSVLILWGEEDATIPLRLARPHFSVFSNNRSVVIPRTAHVPFLEEPGRFAEAVIPFLAEQAP